MWYILGRREMNTRFLWRILKERNHLQCPWCTLEDNIKMYISKTGWDCAVWIHVVQDMDKCWNPVTTVSMSNISCREFTLKWESHSDNWPQEAYPGPYRWEFWCEHENHNGRVTCYENIHMQGPEWAASVPVQHDIWYGLSSSGFQHMVTLKSTFPARDRNSFAGSASWVAVTLSAVTPPAYLNIWQTTVKHVQSCPESHGKYFQHLWWIHWTADTF